jgi:hypothetical protein
MNVRDEHGLIGKALIIWLLILAIITLGILDTVSIATTRFHIADLAAQAAQDGANAYRDSTGTQSAEKTACEAARTSLATADSTIKMTSCKLNTDSNEITITVRKTANTIAAGRIGFLKRYANVEDTETAGPSTL